MTSQLSSDVLDLLGVPSDPEFSGTQPDYKPSLSASASGGNPPVSKSRGKKTPKATESVSRQEFSSLQEKLTTMAEAMQTLQSTVMESMGRPTKRQRTDRDAVSCSDESVATSKIMDSLLQPQEQGATSAEVLGEIEQFYSEEVCGDKVDEKLAGVVSKLLRRKPVADEKIIEKPNSSKRPANIPELEGTRVNPEIWHSLQSKIRSMDIKLQKVEQSSLKGLIPVVLCI